MEASDSIIGDEHVKLLCPDFLGPIPRCCDKPHLFFVFAKESVIAYSAIGIRSWCGNSRHFLSCNSVLKPSGTRPAYGKPFFALYLVPLMMIAASLFLFKGRKLIHGLQVINLLALIWTYIIGVMAVTGIYL